MLSRTSTWTMQRDTQLGVTFVGTLFYDGQAFMVRKDSGATSVHDLDKQTICFEQGTTTELNLEDYFATNKLTYTTVSFVGHDETVKAFLDGKCTAYTTDSSGLAADRSQFGNPGDYIILPDTISKEPLAVLVAQGDDRWFKVTRWVYFALLDAEELGVTSKNIDEMVGSDNPEIKRLLGVGDDDFGTPIGLTKDWAYRVIKGVGNYGEMFDRNVGPEYAARAAARAQRHLEGWRHPVRPADPLTALEFAAKPLGSLLKLASARQHYCPASSAELAQTFWLAA